MYIIILLALDCIKVIYFTYSYKENLSATFVYYKLYVYSYGIKDIHSLVGFWPNNRSVACCMLVMKTLWHCCNI